MESDENSSTWFVANKLHEVLDRRMQGGKPGVKNEVCLGEMRILNALIHNHLERFGAAAHLQREKFNIGFCSTVSL